MPRCSDQMITTKAGRIFTRWIQVDSDHTRPPFVMLHDGLGSVRQWRDLPEVLAHRLSTNVLVYDRLGHGLSDPRPASHDPHFLQEEATSILPELLAQFQLDLVWLLGHSDGGTIALIFAAEFPDIPVKVMTVAAHVFVETETRQGIAVLRDAYRTASLRDKLLKYHGDKTDSLFTGWSDCWLSTEFDTWSIVDRLAQIECPVFAVQGTHDEYGTLAQLHAIAASVRHARVLELPDCGHMPHLQQRARFLQVLEHFFTG